jgi:two-component system, sensor histidine kinase
MDTTKDSQINFDELVKRNAIVMLYNNMGQSAAALSLTPLMVLYTLWNEAEQNVLFSWFGVATTVAGLRWLFYSRRKQVEREAAQHKLWGRRSVVLSLMVGTVWGLTVPLFFHHASSESIIIMMIIIIGLASGSAVAFNNWLPYFYAFATPALLFPTGYFLLRGGDTQIILAILLLVYYFLLSNLVQTMNHTFRENLKLRFMNESLVDELRLEKDLAEASSRAKTRFLASASHDLRQPVHSLSLLREAMYHERDHLRRQELLDLMGNSLDALDQLLGSLLDISKLDAGVLESRSEPTQLKPLLDALLNEVRPYAWDKGLKLRQRKCNHNVVTDQNLLSNILRNLLTNAIRYTENGGVLVACRRKGEKLLIQVWDTGIGIAEREQENIFQEFIQLENQERDRNKGLGLGLAICRRMAYLLGHELSVRSRPGRGSVFTIELPLFEGNLTTTAKPSTTYSHWDLYGKRVLVLDDDDTVRHGMLALLERWGCVTTSAATGEEAIARAREEEYHFDVIVSDYRLPGEITGVQVVGEILAEAGWPIPVVLVTGDTSPERIKEAKESGFPLLHKPVKPAFLRNALGKVLAPKDMELKT